MKTLMSKLRTRFRDTFPDRQRGVSEAMENLIAVTVVALIIAGVAWGVSALFFGKASSETNENCVVYSGGWFEDKNFQKILPAGATRESIGLGSKSYCYRIDQRSYVGGGSYDATLAGQEGNPDAPAVEVVGAASGEDQNSSVRLRVDYQLYFTLNRDPAVLRQFHERLGVKTNAWTTDGWRELLKTYFEPQIERSMEAAALKFPWDDLYADEETRAEFEDETVQLLKAAVDEVIGGSYFCSPSYSGPDSDNSECGDFTFTVGKPVLISEELVGSIENGEVAARNAANQEVQNSQTRTQLDVEREIIELYGPEGALLREAIRSGKVSNFIIAPDGSIVPAVPTPPNDGG